MRIVNTNFSLKMIWQPIKSFTAHTGIFIAFCNWDWKAHWWKKHLKFELTRRPSAMGFTDILCHICGNKSFCRTCFPLACTRWVRSTIKLFCTVHTLSSALQSLNLGNIKNFPKTLETLTIAYRPAGREARLLFFALWIFDLAEISKVLWFYA